MLHQVRSLITVVVLLSTAAPAAAHDMWIEPSTFTPETGQIVSIRLRVGQRLIGDPIPRDPQLVKDFVVDDGSARKPVVGRDGGDPAGFVRPVSPGLLIVGYQSHPSIVEMAADKFNQYLSDEGLNAIATERARRNETTAGAKDMFTRCAKTLLYGGAAKGAAGLDRPLGFELELIAERNPYESNGDVPVRLRLAPAGAWLVKAVHMVPSADRTKADWASYWASLTFESATASNQTQ